MKPLCYWKWIASYYDIIVNGQINTNAAWYYPHPSPLARGIKKLCGISEWSGNNRIS